MKISASVLKNALDVLPNINKYKLGQPYCTYVADTMGYIDYANGENIKDENLNRLVFIRGEFDWELVEIGNSSFSIGSSECA